MRVFEYRNFSGVHPFSHHPHKRQTNKQTSTQKIKKGKTKAFIHQKDIELPSHKKAFIHLWDTFWVCVKRIYMLTITTKRHRYCCCNILKYNKTRNWNEKKSLALTPKKKHFCESVTGARYCCCFSSFNI